MVIFYIRCCLELLNEISFNGRLLCLVHSELNVIGACQLKLGRVGDLEIAILSRELIGGRE